MRSFSLKTSCTFEPIAGSFVSGSRTNPTMTAGPRMRCADGQIAFAMRSGLGMLRSSSFVLSAVNL